MSRSAHSFALVGGLVVDGTGTEPMRADVLIDGGTVEAVLPRVSAAAESIPADYGSDRERVDCSGRLVTPGFVDVHCHSDLSLLVYPDNESRVRQGITTEIVGNCGMSAAPSGGDNPGLASVIGTIDVVPDFNWPWRDVRGWLDTLESTPTATNVAAQVGHGSARFVAAGPEARPLNADELRALERQIDDALDAGCVGVSLGLMYAPGEGADQDELARVGRLAAAHDAVLSVHMRDYGGTALCASVDEVLAVAAASGARVQISHLRQTGSEGDFDAVLERIEDARTTMDVAADTYPYIAGHTNLIQLLPTELRGQGAAQLTVLCRTDPDRVAGLMRDCGYAASGITIMKAPNTPDAVGLAADALAADPWQSLAQLLAVNECIVDVAVNSGRWADVDRALTTAWISIGSDGTALSPAHAASVPHPRSWGAFPAAFRRMRSLGVPTAQAVRRMTDQPASRAGLTAQLRAGHRADVVVFDEDGLTDRATYARPAVASAGLDHVFVQGVPVLSHGTSTGQRPGKLFRGTHYA